MQTERELKMLIIEKAEYMAKVLHKGLDCELRTSHSGITVISNKKEVVIK